MENDSTETLAAGLEPVHSTNGTPGLAKEEKKTTLERDHQWQKQLLPFMRWIFLGLTFYYIASSFYQFQTLKNTIEKQEPLTARDLIPQFSAVRAGNDSFNGRAMDPKIFLEAYVVQNRQKNLELFLLSRTWIKYIGFLTGMILCLVGCIFILGKLVDRQETQGHAESQNIKLSFTSSSPGLILAFLGTVLIFSTLMVNSQIEQVDRSTYLSLEPPPAIRDTAAQKISNYITDTTKHRNDTPQSGVNPPPGE